MVRLKGKFQNPYKIPATRFQFLMVRLKGVMVFGSMMELVISIPYGAIKRITESRSQSIMSLISIPYGAIKSRRPR